MTAQAQQSPSRIVFNKSNLDALPFAPSGKQLTYYDTNRTNLALRVGATSKTFILYTRPKSGGAPVRITLGKYGEITIKHAADLAAKELAKIADGVNPAEEKKKEREAQEQSKLHREQTFEWLLSVYEAEHIINNKGGAEGTLHNLRTMRSYFGEKSVMTLKQKDDGSWTNDMEVHLSDWLNRPFRSITRQEVLDRFDVFNRARPTRTPKVLKPIGRTHQICFKFASSAVNFIIARDELDAKEDYRNPFDILSVRKRWKKTNVRTRMVDYNREDEFGKWWQTVEAYDAYDGLIADYILFSLVQAGRSIDIAPLKWKEVELDIGRIHYVDTKNKLDYIFPITKLSAQILKRRQNKNKDTVHVFDTIETKTGFVPQDCQHHFKRIGEQSGKLVSHHDLRRTWATAARKLKIDERTINYCLKHKMSDVNTHYFVRNEEEILEAMQMVENFFLEQAYSKKNGAKA